MKMNPYYLISNYDLSCDSCNSENIIETREGYVCNQCGLILEIQKFEFHRPYIDKKLQYEVLKSTTIGSQKERFQNQYSRKFEKLNKLQDQKSNDEILKYRVKAEISRILTGLDLPKNHKIHIYNIFKKIRTKLNINTKLRNPDKLIPLIIYFYFKLREMPIDEGKLLEVSKIQKKEYNSLKLQIIRFFPKYAERDRKQFVLNRILEITETFDLSMLFFHESKAILYKLWEYIKHTKDDVIVGVITSILTLCSFSNKITISQICKRLGIVMSTIQYQIKKNLIEKLKIGGFKSLVKSSHIIKRLIKKIFSNIKRRRDSAKIIIKDNKKKKSQHIQLINILFDTYSTLKIEKNKNFLFAIIEGSFFPILIYITENNDTNYQIQMIIMTGKGPPFEKIII